ADLGYLPRKTGAQTLIRDVIADAARMRAAYPGLPLILLGHSMGSFIARLAVTQADFTCEMLILSGTGGRNALAGAGMALQTLLCTLRGERAYSAFIENLMFGTYNNRFEKRTAFDWLSTDTDAVDAYLADPLSGFPFTVSALYVLTALTKNANSAETFRKTPKTLPILLLSGEDDPVGDYGRGVRQTAGAYRNAGVRNVSLTLYPGARHELLNEPIRTRVTDDLLAWIRNTRNAATKGEPT
ncbi:MAG: alpha/beta fold hydrolase, partial [Clostridia bacterium]|nr:alpha/beta fold hydrolase [Clostridia bacterium]